jgi:hypothetical protein
LGVKFDFKGFTTTSTVNDTATVTSLTSVASGSASIERDGSVKETLLVIAPFARYEFFRNGLFLQVGPGISFLLSSNFTHTRVLNSSTIVLTTKSIVDPTKDSTFTVTNARFDNGTRSETLESGKIVNAVSTRISALVTGGWDIPIGDNAVLAPMVTLDLPFTTVRPNSPGASGAADWKITTLYFSVGLKYKLE